MASTDTTSSQTSSDKAKGPSGDLWRPSQFLCFCLLVVRRFFKNNGLLLAGAVAYNTLLSIIPLLAITLATLSQFLDTSQILQTIESNLKLILPGYTAGILKEVQSFLDNRQLFNGISLLALLFFSSLAFNVLQQAMNDIFAHRQQQGRKRRAWLSALIPYLYIVSVGLGILVLTVLKIVLDTIAEKSVMIFSYELSLAGISYLLIYTLTFLAMALLLSSIYSVMPAGRVAFKQAFIGGLTAAFLWEITRRILLWYFTNVSMIGSVYGSFATVVIVLFFFEIGAIIVLLGAQVIAEREKYHLDLAAARDDSASTTSSDRASHG